MESNIAPANMISSNPYGVIDLEGAMSIHHQQAHGRPHPMFHPSMHNVFQSPVGNQHDHQDPTLSMVEYNKTDRVKGSTSDEDDGSLNEDGIDAHNDSAKGKKTSHWQRMKWTDGAVKLLITIVSYLGEDILMDNSRGGRRKLAILQKKGKWKLVSKVMAEKRCFVSPQQCEDKFNDLNKRYKRLNDVLGRGTSCKIVENPALLDMMNLSEKAKEDVRKILSSKHLFYEEMCSYHHGNRIHLPADPTLQRSIQLALRGRDEHDGKRNSHDDNDEDDLEPETEDKDDDLEENSHDHGDKGGIGGANGFFPNSKRIKHNHDMDESNFCNITTPQGGDRRCLQYGIGNDVNLPPQEETKMTLMHSQWIRSRLLELEEQKLHIQTESLELEKQRFKWLKFSRKKDKELEVLKMENERMKLENERMSLELKRKEYEIDYN